MCLDSTFSRSEFELVMFLSRSEPESKPLSSLLQVLASSLLWPCWQAWMSSSKGSESSESNPFISTPFHPSCLLHCISLPGWEAVWVSLRFSELLLKNIVGLSTLWSSAWKWSFAVEMHSQCWSSSWVNGLLLLSSCCRGAWGAVNVPHTKLPVISH